MSNYPDDLELRRLVGQFLYERREVRRKESGGNRLYSRKTFAKRFGITAKTLQRIEMDAGQQVADDTILRVFVPMMNDVIGSNWSQQFENWRSEKQAADSGSFDPADEAISSEIEPEARTPNQKQPAISKTRRLSLLAAGIVVASVALLVGYLEYSKSLALQRDREQLSEWERINDAAQREQDRVAQEMAEQEQLEQAKREAATPELSDLQLVPEFQATWARGNVRISLRNLTGLPTAATFEVSTDGQIFVQPKVIQGFLPSDQFFVRLTSSEWARPVGPFDFTEEAREAVSRELTKQTEKGQGSSFLECFPGSCVVLLHEFCGANWSKLVLARVSDNEERVLDFRQCPNDQRYRKICLSAPHQLFVTNPEQPLVGSLYDDAGKAFEFQFTTSDRSRATLATDPFVSLLEPITDEDFTPFAQAWYEPSRGNNATQFRLQFAVGGCQNAVTALEESFRAVYVDVNGQGWQKGELRYTSIPTPSADTIKVLFENHDGTESGPYEYVFDVAAIIKQWINTSFRPNSFDCRQVTPDWKKREEWHFVCRDKNIGHRIMNWAHVDKIIYGFEEDRLTEEENINIGVDEILNYFEGQSPYASKIFEFALPTGQRSIYFQFLYVDGTRSRVEYLVLR
ncbi:MAG: hypothetical protein AAGG57_12110 [Pseudomonadota bacterium]